MVDPKHVHRDDAVQRVAARNPDAGVVLSCEHASERLPDAWRWPEEDGWLRGTHWSYDIGAAALCHQLADAWGAAAVLAEFSRLLVDPNRPLDSSELFRARAEGRPVAFNQALSDDDRQRRIAFWAAYHEAFEKTVASTTARVVMAIHSFTDEYEGQRRTLEVGVLFDEDEELGAAVAERLRAAGLNVELNQPYSGKEGLIYAAHRHAVSQGRQSVELEVRQDRIVETRFRQALVDALTSFPF